MISKVISPICAAGLMIAAPMLVPKILAKEMIACHDCHMKRLPKAHELPLYETEDKEYVIADLPKSSLEEAISVARKTTTKYMGALDGVRHRTAEIYHTGVAHTKSTYDYITEEDSVIPRSIAVASGGLLGILLGIRGGKFRKLVYASLGAGSVASACYPAQARDLAFKGYTLVTDQTIKVVKDYGGYDLNNATNDLKEKIGNLSVTEQVKDLKITEKISSLANSSKEFLSTSLLPKKTDKATEGDIGQSNPEDKDLYTTRTK